LAPPALPASPTRRSSDLGILGVVAFRVYEVEVQRDPDLRPRRPLAQDLHRTPVREQQVVRGRKRVGLRRAPRRVVTPPVPDPRQDRKSTRLNSSHLGISY